MIFVSEEDYQISEKAERIKRSYAQLEAWHRYCGEAFYETVKTLQSWSDHPYHWPVQFLLDSELNWMDSRTPVDDV